MEGNALTLRGVFGVNWQKAGGKTRKVEFLISSLFVWSTNRQKE